MIYDTITKLTLESPPSGYNGEEGIPFNKYSTALYELLKAAFTARIAI